jgi:hypothetical protein
MKYKCRNAQEQWELFRLIARNCLLVNQYYYVEDLNVPTANYNKVNRTDGNGNL